MQDRLPRGGCSLTPHFNLFSLVLWPGIDPTSRVNIVQKRDVVVIHWRDLKGCNPAARQRDHHACLPRVLWKLGLGLCEPARFGPSSLPEMSRLAQLPCCPELSFATLDEEPGRSKQRTECRVKCMLKARGLHRHHRQARKRCRRRQAVCWIDGMGGALEETGL